MSNLKQIGLGLIQYTQDYDETLPLSAFASWAPYPTGVANGDGYWLWMHNIYPYVKSVQVFNCPSATPAETWDGGYLPLVGGSYHLAYGYNYNLMTYPGGVSKGRSLAAIPQVSVTPFAADSTYYMMDGDKGCSYLHDSTTNPGCDASATANNNDPPMPRHLETFNMLFVDGHVKSQRADAWVTSVASTDSTNPIWQKWNPDYQK